METEADYDAERTMAFKRIIEEFHTPRRRQQEMLKWYEKHPCPLPHSEQLRNLKSAID